jgi:hypothetical protein
MGARGVVLFLAYCRVLMGLGIGMLELGTVEIDRQAWVNLQV